MKCEKCGKNTATTYIKSIISNQLINYALCSDCATQYNEEIPNFDFSIMLKNFFNSSSVSAQKCEMCGTSFEEIKKSGKLGCAKCYIKFYDKLLPIISQIHGTISNKGKTPGKSALSIVNNNNKLIIKNDYDVISEKKNKLKLAIDEERFEDAAILRDEINGLEG